MRKLAHVAAAVAALVALGWWGGREGYRLCDRVRRGAFPVMTLPGVIDPATCALIIREAEAHAEAAGGWETARHDAYPTTDFDTAEVPRLRFPVANLVYREIVPRMAARYRLDPLKLGIGEVFVAKYQARAGQRALAAHTDGSDFSFVIALNAGFRGGGTRFEKSGAVRRPDVGDAVGFAGGPSPAARATSWRAFSGTRRPTGATPTTTNSRRPCRPCPGRRGRPWWRTARAGS